MRPCGPGADPRRSGCSWTPARTWRPSPTRNRPSSSRCARKRCDIAAALLEKGADAGHCVASAGLCPDPRGDVAGPARVPDRALAHGADPNAFDAYGTTPLRVAAIKGDEMGIINKDIIETLIKAGANAKMDEQYARWLKDHPEAQSPAPPEMAGVLFSDRAACVPRRSQPSCPGQNNTVTEIPDDAAARIYLPSSYTGR